MDAATTHPPLVAVEEHYWDGELAARFTGAEASRPGRIDTRLRDFGGERIADMDEAGIAVSVLSHGAPSTQKLERTEAAPLARAVNDRLIAAIARDPGRFAGFAALPTADAEEAADELERAVELGLKGAMLHGRANGEFLDRPRFLPVFARAERLGVPIYLHPAFPHPDVSAAYYDDYLADYPMFARPAWGYTVEAGTQALRLVLSGLFDRHPDLKIVLGHLGESLPFQMWRIDQALARAGQKPIRFREVFRRNFWVTTSGFFSTPALACAIAEMGADRVLFAVDWPFVDRSLPAADWIRGAPIAEDDRRRIMFENAAHLLKIAMPAGREAA